MDSESPTVAAPATAEDKRPATSPARPKLPYFDSLSWFQCYFCQRWRIADFEQASAKGSKWTCLDTFWSDESQTWSSSCQFQEDKPVNCVNPNSGARNKVETTLYARRPSLTGGMAVAATTAAAAPATTGTTKPLTTSDLMQQQAERKRQAQLAKKTAESFQSGAAIPMGAQFDSDAKRARASAPSSATMTATGGGGGSPSKTAKPGFLPQPQQPQPQSQSQQQQQPPMQFLTQQQTRQLLQHQSFRPQPPPAFNHHLQHALQQQQQQQQLLPPSSRKFDRQWFVQFMDRLAMRLSVEPSPLAPPNFHLMLRSYTDTIIGEHTPPHVVLDSLQEVLKWIHHLPAFEQDLREFMQTRL